MSYFSIVSAGRIVSVIALSVVARCVFALSCQVCFPRALVNVKLCLLTFALSVHALSVVARCVSLDCSSLCSLAVCVSDRSAALECQLALPTYAQ